MAEENNSGAKVAGMEYIRVALGRCPLCGVGGETDVLPIPFGGVNHKCSQCGGIVQIESRGFIDEPTRQREAREAREAQRARPRA